MLLDEEAYFLELPLADEGDGVGLVKSLGEALHGAYACCGGEELQFVQVLTCLLFVLVLGNKSDEDGFLALCFSDDKLSHTLQKYDNIYRSCARAEGGGGWQGLLCAVLRVKHSTLTSHGEG